MARKTKIKVDPLIAAQTARAEAARRRWAERHPDRAAAEQLLRRHNRAVRKGFSQKLDGTPETHAHAARVTQGSLARLHLAGEITIDELAAAEAIRAVYQRIVRVVDFRPISLEGRVDNGARAGAAELEALGRVRAEAAYSAWRRRIDRPAAVLAIIVDDVGVSVAARRFGMRNTTAKRLLASALDLWGRCMGDAVRAIG